MNQKERSLIINYRLEKAHQTIIEVRSHLANQLWNTAINRLYYGCYYAVSALLLRNDLNVNTHSGVRQMFSLHFIKSGLISIDHGKTFSKLFNMRHSGDYADFIDYSEEEAEAMVSPAIGLIAEVEKYIKTQK